MRLVFTPTDGTPEIYLQRKVLPDWDPAILTLKLVAFAGIVKSSAKLVPKRPDETAARFEMSMSVLFTTASTFHSEGLNVEINSMGVAGAPCKVPFTVATTWLTPDPYTSYTGTMVVLTVNSIESKPTGSAALAGELAENVVNDSKIMKSITIAKLPLCNMILQSCGPE